MSSFNSGGSKWSGERQRQERERQREAQKELMRKARLEREEKQKADEEARKAAREANERASRSTTTPPPSQSATPVTPTITSSTSGSTGVGRKWRNAAEGSSTPTGGALPDIPELGNNRSTNRGGTPSISGRIVLLAAVLFILMGLAFLPFSPFRSGGGDDTTPTPTSEVPVVIGSTTPGSTNQALVVPTAVSDGSRVVCIDPGHGGWDYGFQRTWEEMSQQGPALNESEVNLGMAYMLKAQLEAQGITVVMTRTGGDAVNVYGEDVNGDGKTIFDGADDKERRQNGDYDELQARIDICNEAKADILVSLHINGFPTDPSINGYEVLYTAAPARPFGELSHQLADDVYRRMDRALQASGYPGSGRNVKDDSQLDASKYPGYGTSPHLLLLGPAIDNPNRKLRPSEMPGIIIEPMFLSNEDDANFIANPKNQQLLVEAYAQGILDYFAANPG